MDLTGILYNAVTDLLTGAVKTAVFKRTAKKQLSKFISIQEQNALLRKENAIDGMEIPPFLIASITRDCNLNCQGCYSAENSKGCGNKPPLSANRWEEIFLQAGHLGVSYILIAGGEPLLRRDILEKAANIKNILFPVFTNAMLLDDGYAKFFDKNRNLIPVISLEGDKKATEARRGTGVYERLISAMRLLSGRRVMFGVSVTLTAKNIFDVASLDFAKDLNSKGANILFYVEYVPADGVSDSLAPDEKTREAFEKRLHALRKMTNMLFISFPGDEDFTEGCLAAGRGFAHINHAGDLEPCPFSPYSDTNLSGISLKEALKSPFLKKVREDGMLKGEHKGGCLLFEKRAEVIKLLQG